MIIFQDLVNNMRAQDDDKPMSSQYLLTWGDKLGKNPKPSGKEFVIRSFSIDLNSKMT